MNIEQLKEKYQDIENKIPIIWKDYNSVSEELKKDLENNFQINSISTPEIIRVISLVSLYTDVKIYDYIDQRFFVAGLYPQMSITEPSKDNDK